MESFFPRIICIIIAIVFASMYKFGPFKEYKDQITSKSFSEAQKDRHTSYLAGLGIVAEEDEKE